MSGVFFAPLALLALLISPVRSVCYNRQSDFLQDTLSNPLVFCFLIQRPLAYSLPRKLKLFYIRYLGKSLPRYALSCERVYNCHLDNDAYYALVVAVV
jgi:hypothetical protein